MKLVMAIIQDQDADRVIGKLTESSYRVTRMATSGGFLQQGNTTLLVGIDDERVQPVIDIMQHFCQRRTQYMPMATGAAPAGVALYNYVEVEIGGATVFVMDVDHFEQV